MSKATRTPAKTAVTKKPAAEDNRPTMEDHIQGIKDHTRGNVDNYNTAARKVVLADFKGGKINTDLSEGDVVVLLESEFPVAKKK